MPNRLFFLPFLICATPALAAPIAVSISHSGYLLDATDHPLEATAQPIGFAIWDDVTATDASHRVWPASAVTCPVDVRGGYYAVELGTGCAAGLTSAHVPPGASRWLEVKVGAVTLTPRVALTTAPAASVASLALALPDGAVTNAMLEHAELTVNAGAGLTGGGAAALGGATTLALPTIGTAGSFSFPNLTIDAYGRVTAAANGSLGPASIGATELASDATALAKVTGGTALVSGGNVGVGSATPAAKLDVAGGVKVSTTPTDTCGATQQGTVRFKAGTFEGCDGSTWVRFGGGAQLITTSTTLQVPAQYATLQAALDSLADKQISQSATVTIQLADGTYTSTQPVDLKHADLDKIQILGNATSPQNVVLQFNNSTGILVQSGHRLRLLNGVTINGNDNVATNGVLVTHGSHVQLGTAVRVRHFGQAVYAAYRSSIWAQGLVASDCSPTCITAQQSSFVFADGASVTNAGIAYYAGFNSYVWANAASAAACSGQCFYAGEHSGILAANAVATPSGTGMGFYAWGNAFIRAEGASSTGGGYGFYGDRGAVIMATNAVVSGPTFYGFYAQGASHLWADGSSAIRGTVQGSGSGYVAVVGSSIEASNATSKFWASYGYYADRGSFIDAGGTSTRVAGNATNWQPNNVVGNQNSYVTEN